MKRTFTTQEMKDQIFAIACNHKKATVRSVKSITGFDADFIEQTLNEFMERGTFKRSDSYIVDGDKVNEQIWHVKKKYLQADIFGAVEDDAYEDAA